MQNWTELVNWVMDMRREYPEATTALTWSIFILLIAFRWVFSSKPPTGLVKGVSDALSSPSMWRWGMSGGKPTGKSVIYENDGRMIIVNFKNNAYFTKMAGEKGDGVSVPLTRKEKRVLRAKVMKVVSHLNEIDRQRAELAAAQRRRESEDFVNAALSRRAGPPRNGPPRNGPQGVKG